mmetsp:Transcript_25485/g.61385  ORF Transcript_25485/g.61385 Transcript_25485/m.61385 type:complete len:97 (-) Transcript_25485:446-736(-)
MRACSIGFVFRLDIIETVETGSVLEIRVPNIRASSAFDRSMGTMPYEAKPNKANPMMRVEIRVPINAKAMTLPMFSKNKVFSTPKPALKIMGGKRT